MYKKEAAKKCVTYHAFICWGIIVIVVYDVTYEDSMGNTKFLLFLFSTLLFFVIL